MFQMVYGGRYIVLLMGAFSVFTGMMYNDIFSRALPFFQSGWHFDVPEDYDGKTTIVAQATGHTYAFGIDYAWHGTENFLLFTNSYKMKMSIILGVIHMSTGICMVYFNAKFFRKRIDVIGSFIPQMIFMQCLFGYLVAMILYKWSVDWFEVDAAGHAVRNSPPSLLNTMIYMFLSPGTVKEGERLYSGQVSRSRTIRHFHSAAPAPPVIYGAIQLTRLLGKSYILGIHPSGACAFGGGLYSLDALFETLLPKV